MHRSGNDYCVKSSCLRKTSFLEISKTTSFTNIRVNNRLNSNVFAKFMDDYKTQRGKERQKKDIKSSEKETPAQSKNRVLSIQNLKINVNLIKNHRYMLSQDLVNLHSKFKPIIDQAANNPVVFPQTVSVQDKSRCLSIISNFLHV